jgi:AcrR family transcriptional regulator
LTGPAVVGYNAVNLTSLNHARRQEALLIDDGPDRGATEEEDATTTAGDGDAGRLGEDRILAAARDLLVEGGLDALSMRAVASRVDVSAAAIYHYFENKRELVDHMVGTTFRRIEADLREAAERWPEGSLERLRAIEQGYIDFALEHEQYFRALFALRSERLREMEDHPAEGCYRLLHETVTAAMDAGNVTRRDADEVVLYLWTAVHGLVALSLACKLEVPPGGRRVDARDLFESSWTMMLEGLRGDAAAPAGDAGRVGPGPEATPSPVDPTRE